MKASILVVALFTSFALGEKCPKRLEEWLKSRADFAETIPTSPEKFLSCYEKSAALFKSDEKLRKCFKEHREMAMEFVKGEKAPSVLINSEAYETVSKPYVEIPKELQMRSFLNAITRGKVEEAEATLKKENEKRRENGSPVLHWIKFSTDTGTVDGTKSGMRFIVYDPGTSGLYSAQSFSLRLLGNSCP